MTSGRVAALIAGIVMLAGLPAVQAFAGPPDPTHVDSHTDARQAATSGQADSRDSD